MGPEDGHVDRQVLVSAQVVEQVLDKPALRDAINALLTEHGLAGIGVEFGEFAPGLGLMFATYRQADEPDRHLTAVGS